MPLDQVSRTRHAGVTKTKAPKALKIPELSVAEMEVGASKAEVVRISRPRIREAVIHIRPSMACCVQRGGSRNEPAGH